jgi:hypothetical protein
MSILRRKRVKKYNSSDLLNLNFIHKGGNPQLVYTIIEHNEEKHKDDFVFVTWETADEPLVYSVKGVKRYFKEGFWVKI